MRLFCLLIKAIAFISIPVRPQPKSVRGACDLKLQFFAHSLHACNECVRSIAHKFMISQAAKISQRSEWKKWEEEKRRKKWKKKTRIISRFIGSKSCKRLLIIFFLWPGRQFHLFYIFLNWLCVLFAVHSMGIVTLNLYDLSYVRALYVRELTERQRTCLSSARKAPARRTSITQKSLTRCSVYQKIDQSLNR